MTRTHRFALAVVFLAAIFLVPAAPTPIDLAARVVGIAAVVAGFLQGFKQYVPVSGWISRIISWGLAFVGAVATAPAGHAVGVTLASGAVAAFTANGVHGFFKTASGQPTSSS